MNINSAFPSNYLKAADLHGGRTTVTIDSVAIEDIGGEDKPILYFQGKEKGLVLNKTNANMIAEIAKDEETDHWTGVRITIYSTKVDFQGRRVDAIRVDYPAASDRVNGNNNRQAQPSRAMLDQPPPHTDKDKPLDDDTDVPF